MSLDYVLAAVGVVAPYGITPGDITADDPGWTEIGSLANSTPNNYGVSSGNPHENQTTSIALKVFSRTVVGGTVGGPWTFSVTQDEGTVVYNFGGSVNPNGTAAIGGVLFRYGRVTGVGGTSTVSESWGDGTIGYTTGPAPGHSVVIPSAGGTDPSVTVLITNSYGPGTEYPQLLYPSDDYAGGIGTLRVSLLNYDGPKDITLEGQVPGWSGAYNANWGTLNGVVLNLSGTYTLCDSDWDEVFAESDPTLTVSLTTDSYCPRPTALYGWGLLTGSGSGGAW